MDLSTDQLDYEEDELDTISVNNSPNKNSATDVELSENSNFSGCTDQYLQLDCPEEEEDFASHSENIKPTEKVVPKGDEKNVNPQNVIISTEIKKFDRTDNGEENSKTNNNNKKTIQKNVGEKHIIKYPCESERKKIVSEFNLYSPQNSLISPIKVINGDQEQTFPNVAHKRFIEEQTLNSVSLSGTGVDSQITDSVHQRKKSCSIPSSGSHLKKFSEVQTKKDGAILSKFFHLKNMISDTSTRPENIQMSTSVIESNSNISDVINQGSLTGNLQTDDMNKGLDQQSFRNESFNNPNAGIRFSASGMENNETKNERNSLKMPCNFLKDDEKKLVILKKEARLKRFMHDATVRQEKKTINPDFNNTEENCLHLGADYFQKMEEQKLARERFLRLKSQHRKNRSLNYHGSQYEKPHINKESLLKKINPFDGNYEMSKCPLTAVVKKEDETSKIIKQEYDGGNVFTSNNWNYWKLPKMEETNISTDFYPTKPIKNEATSPVKADSKTFDELPVRKLIEETVIEKKELNSSIISKNWCFKLSDSQLIGCIVKVFNIPPSTTTNDILAICSPIGVVMEVKLNFPRENSAVIRFAEPDCAERFFTLFHGQKFNNYFLNVIVV